MALNFSYEASKKFCEEIGLTWMGDDYGPLIGMDVAAKQFGFTQEQVTEGMRHHLWQVKILFSPAYYNWKQRISLAFYFLTGWKLK